MIVLLQLTISNNVLENKTTYQSCSDNGYTRCDNHMVKNDASEFNDNGCTWFDNHIVFFFNNATIKCLNIIDTMNHDIVQKMWLSIHVKFITFSRNAIFNHILNTLVNILDACIDEAGIAEGRRVHKHIIVSSFVYGILVQMYFIECNCMVGWVNLLSARKKMLQPLTWAHQILMPRL